MNFDEKRKECDTLSDQECKGRLSLDLALQ